MENQRICRQDGLVYEYQGEIEGYEIYVHYAEQGPDAQEAMALFEEARRDSMFQMMLRAAIGLEGKAAPGRPEKPNAPEEPVGKKNEISEDRTKTSNLSEKLEESEIGEMPEDRTAALGLLEVVEGTKTGEMPEGNQKT